MKRQHEVFRKVTVYIRQNLFYASDDDLQEQIDWMEMDIYADINNMQDDGRSFYEFRCGEVESVDENDFPTELFE